MLKSLSGRFLILTMAFVMLAEVLIFVPSVARFRADFLLSRLERAQIASLVLLADDMIEPALEKELLENAEVYNVVLRRDDMRELVLSSDLPEPVAADFDLRDVSPLVLMRDALMRLADPSPHVIRVIGRPVRMGGELIEVTMNTAELRKAMIGYGKNIALLSAVISAITASLLFLAVRFLMVRPIRDVVGNMKAYSQSPEDTRRIMRPHTGLTELHEAEVALQSLQTELTHALKQKDRLAQLGGAVARISHDLRNILTTAQLFADRMESSQDPMVKRVGPKLMNSISRAINLCENTLAFGKAEEPAPRLERVELAGLVDDIFSSERLAAGEHDLRFAQDVPVGLTVRADPEQLYRVLSNLIRNARQAIVATNKPGEIVLTACETAECWEILVQDSGPGLPHSTREALFQPFAGSNRKGGSGLGLAIAAELVRGHGGELSLVGSDQTGTRFKILLPKDIGGAV